jgi:TolA-binding protein
MAKTCEVCQRPYPDELAACPNCGSTKTMSADELAMMAELLGIEKPAAPIPVDPPSDVNLSEEERRKRPPKPGDVGQMASWLFREGQQGPRPGQPARPPEPPPAAPPPPTPPPVPSLFNPNELTPPPGGRRAVDLAFESLNKKPTDSSSAIDLGRTARPEAPPAKAGAPAEPAAGESSVILAEAVPDSGSGPASPESSAVDLGQHVGRPAAGREQAAPSSGESSVILADPVSDQLPPPVAERPADVPPGVAPGSDHDIDIVAESADSGVNLAKPHEPPAGEKSSGGVALERPDDDPSSAVQLAGGPDAGPGPDERELLGSSGADALIGEMPPKPSRRDPMSSEVDLVVGDEEAARLLAGSDTFEPISPPPQTGAAALEEEYPPPPPEEARPEAVVTEEATAYEQAVEEPQAEAETFEEEEAPAYEEPERPGREPVAAGAGAPARPRRGGWLGGTIVGVLLGLLVSFGLWIVGIEPPVEWRAAAGFKTRPATNQGSPASQATALAKAAEEVRSGDFDKAQAVVEQIQEDQPDQLALRGEYRWLTYLRDHQLNKAPLRADDDQVQKAIDDLTKAGTADALFWLGDVYKNLNNTDKARETWTQALDKYRDDPRQKRRFQAALNRLDLQAEKAAGAARAPRDAGPEPDAALLALALIALQGAGGPADSGEEAGYKFWEAVKLARQQDYPGALAALKEARSEHDRLRFSRLRKAQNPDSDPTEEIFLRACDELTAYWQVQQRLKSGGYLDAAAKKSPVKAVEELVQKAGSGGTGATELANKLIKEKIIAKPEELNEGIDRLVTDRKNATEGMTRLTKEANDAKKEANDAKKDADAAKKEAADAKAKLQMVEANLKKAEENLAKAEDRVRVASDQAAAAKAAMKKVQDELVAAKLVDARAGDTEILNSVKNLIKTASNAPAADLLKQVQMQVQKAEADAKAAKDKLTAAEGLVKKLNEDVAARDAIIKKAREDMNAADGDRAALKLVRDELVAAKVLDSRADNAALLKGVKDLVKNTGTAAADLLKRVQAAEAKEKEAADAAAASKAALKKAQDELGAAKTASAGMAKRAETAEAEAKAVRDNLRAAEARAKQAADAVVASKDALKKVQDELVGAKVLDPRADEAAVLQGVRALVKAATGGDKVVKPVVTATVNPDEAEKHYAAGLSRYFARRYADAEAEFLRAVENYGEDARFYYFLGLSRFMQGKPSAADFAQGAALEQEDRPGLEAVSKALERVQGEGRTLVNEARRRPR